MWGLHVHVSGAQEAGWTLMMKGKHDPFLEQIAGVTGTHVDEYGVTTQQISLANVPQLEVGSLGLVGYWGPL
jgi:hypothetical protein